MREIVTSDASPLSSPFRPQGAEEPPFVLAIALEGDWKRVWKKNGLEIAYNIYMYPSSGSIGGGMPEWRQDDDAHRREER